VRVRNLDGTQLDSSLNSFGTTITPVEFRAVDYSEINHDTNTGEIEFLKGSSIDEANFTVIFNASNGERNAAHNAYAALASSSVSNNQYRWMPNENANDNSNIDGYRKELSLSVNEEGASIMQIRVVGFQGASLATVRKAPYISAMGGSGNVCVYVEATAGAYELQYALAQAGPWRGLPATGQRTTHGSLHQGSVYYYRARSNGTQNPWSRVASARAYP